MSQLTNIPLQDNYRSTLSQTWDGNTWTIYVNTVPSFTFPSWVKTYICVDPGKTTMQVARISAYDATLKTITVDSITVDKGNGVAYTAQTHTVGSVIEISDNYQFREDIQTAINTKVNTNSTDTDTGKFADAAARDAYFTSPVNGNSAYLTAEGKRTDYVWGTWVDRATGTTSNASTTVSGKVEISTQTETEDQTATWWTWAIIVPTNATINPNNITSTAPATGDKIAFADISNSNKLRSTTIQTAVDTARPLATNTEASTGTGTTQSITPAQLKKYFWPEPIAWTTYTASSISWSVWSVTSASWTYAQAKIWTIQRTWTYRISVTIWAIAFWTQWYAKMYKNWSAFSTEQTNATWSPVTVTRDLAYTEWDTISLWIKSNGWWSWTISFTDLSIKYDLTNQNAFALA